jgi:hypothetical protein
MGLAHQEVADQEAVEVWEEAAEARAGWEATNPGLAPVGTVFVLAAEPDYPIR